MIKQTVLSLIGVIIVGSTLHAADAPEIINVSKSEVCGKFNGVRPSIDVDSKGQPHVVVDSGHAALGSTLMMYNKIGGKWRGRTFASRTSEGYSPSAISQPWIEIDAKDRMWAFAQYFRAGSMRDSGQGVWLYSNISTSPRKTWFHKKQYGRHGWGPGNLSIDPKYPNEAVVMTIDGAWGKISSSGATIGSGYMGPKLSGEKFRFRIAPYADGSKRGVWHGVMNGSSVRHSSYRNSTMKEDAVWASHRPYYGTQGDDHNHAGVCGDLQNPEIGYMAAVFEDGGSHNGLQFNVWRGNSKRFVYSSRQLGILDSHATFIHRYAPALTPAHGNDGGCWAAWGNEHGHIWVAYIDQNGKIRNKEHVADGFTCAINTDKDGNLHMAYNSHGYVRYLKLGVSGASSQRAFTDYDGDGKSDLTVFGRQLGTGTDTGAVLWHIYLSESGDYIGNRSFGHDSSTPVEGDFNGDGKTDMAVFNNNGSWYVSYDFGRSAKEYKFGNMDSIPITADFDGDGKTDCAVYQARANSQMYSAGTWYILNSGSGKLTSFVWGNESYLPAAADFDGDGKADPAVYNPNTGQWYVYYTQSKKSRFAFKWGNSSADYLAGDYTGAGMTELSAMASGGSGTYWYFCDKNNMGVPKEVWQFGAPGYMAVAGDWDGDGVRDLSVYKDGRWHILLSESGKMWEPGFGNGETRPLSQFYGYYRMER